MGNQKNCKRTSPESDSARKLILIDSVVYDVTRFDHPGGHVLDYLCFSDMNRCIDASAAFHEFHFRTDSKKMRAYLKSLPKVEGKFKLRFDKNETNRRTLLTKDFFEMRKRLESEGVFDLCQVHVFLRCLEIVCLFALGSFLVTTSLGGQTIMAGLLKVIFGALMLGLAQGRCGWLMHEAGHRSLTGVPKLTNGSKKSSLDLAVE